jgi:DNA-binding response OmpR family regulator
VRIVLASSDSEASEWLAHVLGDAGYSVVVLDEITPSTPELRGADLLIADASAASSLGDAGPARRMLLSSRGGTVDLAAVQGRFADVLALPTTEEEVVARVRYLVNR